MKRRYGIAVLSGGILLVLAGTGGWYAYGPLYLRNRQVAAAESALAANNLELAEERLQPLVQGEQRDQRSEFLYAQVLRRRGRTGEAEVALLWAKKLGLPEAEGRREFGLLEASQDFPAAEGALRQVLKEHPEDEEIVTALAAGYSGQQRWVEASDVYSGFLARHPERSDLLLARSRARKEAEHFDEAIADCRELLRRSPDHFQARMLLAHCLLSDARMKEAEPELARCHQLQPERSEPLVGLATCALERGQPDQAQELLKQALALDPDSVAALNEQGSLYLRRQQGDLAIAQFEHVLRLAPGDKQAHLKLAQALRQKGDLEQAAAHVRRYQELDREEEQRLGSKRGMH